MVKMYAHAIKMYTHASVSIFDSIRQCFDASVRQFAKLKFDSVNVVNAGL